MEYAIYHQAPQGFKVDMQAAGCYLICQNKLLFLKRHPSCPQGNTWGVPGGKLEAHETAQGAVIREIREEVGLDIRNGVHEAGKLFISIGTRSHIFHMFYKHYATFPDVTLCVEESVESRWVTYDEALSLPLIIGGREALAYCQSIWSSSPNFWNASQSGQILSH